MSGYFLQNSEREKSSAFKDIVLKMLKLCYNNESRECALPNSQNLYLHMTLWNEFSKLFLRRKKSLWKKMTYIHLYIHELKTFKYIPYVYHAKWLFQPFNTPSCITNSNMRSIFDQINAVKITLVIPKPWERITFPSLFIFLSCFHIQIPEYHPPWGHCGFWMATCMFLTNLSGFVPDSLWILAVYGQLE